MSYDSLGSRGFNACNCPSQMIKHTFNSAHGWRHWNRQWHYRPTAEVNRNCNGLHDHKMKLADRLMGRLDSVEDLVIEITSFDWKLNEFASSTAQDIEKLKMAIWREMFPCRSRCVESEIYFSNGFSECCGNRVRRARRIKCSSW